MAAPECEREARKRRERRDSGCAHERKERRPHSEERPPPPPPPPPLHDYNRLEVGYNHFTTAFTYAHILVNGYECKGSVGFIVIYFYNGEWRIHISIQKKFQKKR